MSEQLSLIPADEMARLTDQEVERRQYAQGIYSGVDVKRLRPELYGLTISWIAQGAISDVEISKRTGLSRNTVAGIRKTQHADIEQVKKELGEVAFDSASMTMDAYRQRMLHLLQHPDELNKLSPERLSLAWCQMVDKGLLVSGEATQRIEVERVDPDEFSRRFLALPSDQQARLAAMGVGPEISGAKEAPVDADFDVKEATK